MNGSIVPAYDFFSNPNEILLKEAPVSLQVANNTYSGSGAAKLTMLPRPNIYLYGSFENVDSAENFKIYFDLEEKIIFSFDGQNIDGLHVGGGGDVPKKILSIKWCPRSIPIVGVGNNVTAINNAVFHLFNFPNFYSSKFSYEENDTTRLLINHLTLIYNDWESEIQSLISTSESINLIKDEGGYRLTHIGRIQKSNNTSFSGEELDEFLFTLRLFLSLAAGGWRDPVCTVGYGMQGDKVWEQWSCPTEQRYYFPHWFDRFHPEQLEALFPLFMRKWHNDGWGETLREVIYWYLKANASYQGIDAGIILTQAAMELLAYQLAVKEKRLISARGFKKLYASDKFRMLFSSLGISLDIPAETSNLRCTADNMKWIDAPHALTEMRNSLIHPEHDDFDVIKNALHDAWNLGLWYLEMGILAVCEYNGKYSNRLKTGWEGQLDDVPWIKTPDVKS
ncbi:MAG: hypothetical protein WC959_01095 [Kiritimatiellales bacterium]